MTKPTTIDEYIAQYPAEVQELLQKVRQTIHQAAPEAQEKISYGLATFTLHGNLVHFGAFDKHLGFYPTPSGIAAFEKHLSKYQASKGAVQFPFDQPIPYDLITEMVKFRVAQNTSK